ncbi:hypothetical protein PHYSODRAFT_307719 [Phytophthora sojae]|uniref:Uncharacterized protein n=1 Tax=Phytophthora sojae (strain P6497) TaxID=1094619 RepID=G5AFR7_PHYSP|nr:hypothetical protein PHYSODRAFT_307719 [Phytophthora sojae]EGZ05433.1 hypothetical protein PHYSODRAFT_307719 [Phytophthora sojae]|eukprot:XP_009538964.1 hypothetical protein PHYSODRAFT_307719 [Phytophthora sojae]
MASESSSWHGSAPAGADIDMGEDGQATGRQMNENQAGSRTKRQRARTDQDAEAAGCEEEELIGDMSEGEWGALQSEFQTTNTVISFSMSGGYVYVDDCRMYSKHFQRDILEPCRANGVLFEDNKLSEVESVKKGAGRIRKHVTSLTGIPVKLDRALWLMLKPGFLEVKGVQIWMQPLFTGRKNMNLTLNELEYVKCNRVSFGQLLAALRQWGGA